MYFLKPAIALMVVQSFAAVAWAEVSFDGSTPPCEIPIFHWGLPRPAPQGANRFALKMIAGSVEKNQKWQPFGAEGNLAGEGMYFEGDPFSSHSYGSQLLIAYLKPSQPMKDVRSLQELDVPKQLDKAVPAIRSDNPLLVHRWDSEFRNRDAIVVRGRKTMKETELPFNRAKTELIQSTDSKAQPWSEHAEVTPGESLGQILQKYTDRYKDLDQIWKSAYTPAPSDELIWSAIKIELAEATEDSIGGNLDLDNSGVYWEPFDSCYDMEPQALAEAMNAFIDAKLLDKENGAKTSCELKAQLVKKFKTTVGYDRYLGIYSYIQNWKRSLGIASGNEAGKAPASVFDATCKPF